MNSVLLASGTSPLTGFVYTGGSGTGDASSGAKPPGAAQAASSGLGASAVAGNAFSSAALGALIGIDLLLSEFTKDQIAGVSASVIGHMSATELSDMTATEVSGFSAAHISALNSTQIVNLSQTSLAGLSAAAAVSLSAAQVQALSVTQLASLTTTAFAAISGAHLSSTVAANLNATEGGALTKAQIAAMSVTAIGALSTTALASVSAAAAAGLAATQIAALSSTQTNALTTAEVSAMSSAAFNAINVGNLTTGALDGLGTTKFASLTANQVGQMNVAEVGALSANQLNALSTSGLGGLNATEIGELSAGQLQGLTTATLNKLTAQQFGELSATQIGQLSTTQLGGLSATNLNAIVQASLGVSIGGGGGGGGGGSTSVADDVLRLESNGSLSYASMLTILQDAASGGMTSTKFAALQQLAGELNTQNGITTSAYVQQMTDNVVDGNSANADWNGGSSTATALGNLSATSSATQVNELIGKWFLGTDLPSTDVSQVDGGSPGIAYQTTSLPLYSGGAPQIGDINQGDVGDCYFDASLGATAMQDPSLIQNMIQSNGNGTYSVLFHINGQDDYVTVNSQLPVFTGPDIYPDGSKLAFDNGSTAWAPLIEKAYAQLMEQTAVTPGASLNQHGDSYADTSGGDALPITEITGKSYNTYSTAGQSGSGLTSLLTTLQTSLAAGQEVLLGTSPTTITSGNLVESHMFVVTGVNASAGTVTLENPWGANSSTAGKAESFSIAATALVADSAFFFASYGVAAAA